MRCTQPGVPANYDQPWSWTVPYQELGDNATNTCEDYCCGVNDVNSTHGSGQEGHGHYCAYELAPGTYLSDQRDTFVALENLRTMGTDYKNTGKPFFGGLGVHKPVRRPSVAADCAVRLSGNSHIDHYINYSVRQLLQ